MALYKVEINKQVRKKDLLSIPKKDLNRIIARITELSNNPYPSGAVRLKGREEWQIRQGDYRILYIVEAQIVTVFTIKIGHRREVYNG